MNKWTEQPTAHCGTSEMLCVFTQDKDVIMTTLLIQNENISNGVGLSSRGRTSLFDGKH